MSGWGGARPGSGRKPKKLIDLIEAGSFTWNNKRHRRLLEEDETFQDIRAKPESRIARLQHIQRVYVRYRQIDDRSASSALAQQFAAIARRQP